MKAVLTFLTLLITSGFLAANDWPTWRGPDGDGKLPADAIARLDRQRLHEQIWDAGQFNDQSLMPPFGRHEILSSREIDAIVAFLYTL